MLNGKNAVITGCNRGIGKAILENFTQNGANIFACARNKTEEFEILINDLSTKYSVKIIPIYFDMTDSVEMKNKVKEIFSYKVPIDILVNNAGIAYNGAFQMTSINKLREVFDVNFFSVVEFTQLIIRNMVKNKKGRIINLSSMMGIDIVPGSLAYSASKSAVISLTKTLSAEFSSVGITANAIAPGYIDTDMAKISNQELIDRNIEKSAIKRLGTPEEVANLVVFLASDNSSYITGQVIRIDGGIA